MALGTAAAVTTRIGLGTSVALPAAHNPIALAKTIATVDHLSGGRVILGVGYGWNLEELADHGVPSNRRRTVLREYLEAMTALWTQEEAAWREIGVVEVVYSLPDTDTAAVRTFIERSRCRQRGVSRRCAPGRLSAKRTGASWERWSRTRRFGDGLSAHWAVEFERLSGRRCAIADALLPS